MTDKNAGKLSTQSIDLKMLETEFYNPSSFPKVRDFDELGAANALCALCFSLRFSRKTFSLTKGLPR